MNENERKAIGERVKQIRESHNPKLSQAEFGEPIKLSRSTINNIERGDVLHVESYLKTIELYYHVNPVWFATGRGEMITKVKREDIVEEEMGDNADVFTKTWMKTLVTLPDEAWEEFKKQLEKIEDIRKRGV